jgi:succinate dehydrogenase/fumarate reductase flavoprotein subunit
VKNVSAGVPIFWNPSKDNQNGGIEMRDIESDVVIIGCGIAGSVAAITAHDSGAKALILEKMPNAGGNCPITMGNILTPTKMEFVDYLEALSFKTTEREILETFVKVAIGNADWVRKMGGEVILYHPLSATYPLVETGPGFPQVKHSEYMVKYNVKGARGEGSGGERLWNLVRTNLEQRSIEIMTNTDVKEVVKSQKGEVVGVLAESQGKGISVNARKAVILASGGYANDAATKWDFYHAKPLLFLGSPANTGDGIRLGQKVGAALWHMTNMISTIGFKAPEYEAAFGICFHDRDFIYVDKYGKRYIDEIGVEVHEFGREMGFFDTQRIEYPRIPTWVIFGEQCRRKGPLNTGAVGYNRKLYKWSKDNAAEISKGWIVQAQSVSELANKISVDEINLENTIKKYNGSCKTGKDPDFGRAEKYLVAIEAPYYAIQISPALYCTQGGPRRDKDARVLDPDAKPIPRLYEAGELGSITGGLYQGGNSLSECIVFGRIAGRNAAAEKDLTQAGHPERGNRR